MKILFALDKFSRSEGGSDKLARGAVAALCSRGHEVRVLQAGTSNREEILDTVPVSSVRLENPFLRDSDLTAIKWNRQWLPVVREEIKSFRPQLLLTQNRLAPASVSAARAEGVRSAVFFHGYKGFSPTFFFREDPLAFGAATWGRVPLRCKLKWPWVKAYIDSYIAACRDADLVIANSDYCARVIEKICGRKAEVFYPVADLRDPEAKTGNGFRADVFSAPVKPADGHAQPGHILFVKPQAIKGLEELLSVAKLLPEKKFVVVGAASRRTAARLRKIKNIEYLSWVDNMAAVYGKASALFGPSQIPEPFGRVFVEAGLYGVPSVASAWGGMVEAVGAGGALLPFDSPAQDWANALAEACGAKRAVLSAAARANALAIVSAATPERLCQLLNIS